jgi:hypothetical protein
MLIRKTSSAFKAMSDPDPVKISIYPARGLDPTVSGSFTGLSTQSVLGWSNAGHAAEVSQLDSFGIHL